jgi:hypothetical protein
MTSSVVFPQYILANSGVVPRVTGASFRILSNLSFTCHRSIRRYVTFRFEVKAQLFARLVWRVLTRLGASLLRPYHQATRNCFTLLLLFLVRCSERKYKLYKWRCTTSTSTSTARSFTADVNTPQVINPYNLLTYGAEPFLRNCQLCSCTRTSQHFMEPEGSLSCSQQPSTGLHISMPSDIITITNNT